MEQELGIEEVEGEALILLFIYLFLRTRYSCTIAQRQGTWKEQSSLSIYQSQRHLGYIALPGFPKPLSNSS